MRKNELITEWLRRANSNLIRAKSLKINDEVYYEDLCFDAQQCVEKSLIALCIFYEIPFPKSHDIFHLFELLENKKVKIPLKIKKAENLADYSVETRYPVDYEEVNEIEYNKVVKIAGDVNNWVCN